MSGAETIPSHNDVESLSPVSSSKVDNFKRAMSVSIKNPTSDEKVQQEEPTSEEFKLLATPSPAEVEATLEKELAGMTDKKVNSFKRNISISVRNPTSDDKIVEPEPVVGTVTATPTSAEVEATLVKELAALQTSES